MGKGYQIRVIIVGGGVAGLILANALEVLSRPTILSSKDLIKEYLASGG
jgi:aspartate oxidase